jgi:hypothetical protein
MSDVAKIIRWVDNVGQGVKAIDAPLHNNFSKLSQARGRWEVDLRKVYRNTLTAFRPNNAVVSVAAEIILIPMLICNALDHDNQSRYSAWSDDGNAHRALLQAPGIRPHAAAARGPPLRLLRRCLRNSGSQIRASSLWGQTPSSSAEPETVRLW